MGEQKKNLASKHWLLVGRLFGLEKIINLHLWHWTSFVLLKKNKALNSFLTLPLPSSQKLDPQQRGKRKICDTFRVIYRNMNYQGPGRVHPLYLIVSYSGGLGNRMETEYRRPSILLPRLLKSTLEMVVYFSVLSLLSVPRPPLLHKILSLNSQVSVTSLIPSRETVTPMLSLCWGPALFQILF